MTTCYVCGKQWNKTNPEKKYDFCGVCMKKMYEQFEAQFRKRLPPLRIRVEEADDDSA